MGNKRQSNNISLITNKIKNKFQNDVILTLINMENKQNLLKPNKNYLISSGTVLSTFDKTV